ncbi:MAG: hypothetical protein KAU03_05715 [Candidatus Altiarchaeales archaeon]|nr:hypothetical protein [Candidatus Altiarchaeales archaeon]
MITTVTTTTTTTIVTSSQVFIGGMIAVVTLIILLALREILGADTEKNPILQTFVNTSGIVSIPLLFAFIAIVIHKIMLIL